MSGGHGGTKIHRVVLLSRMCPLSNSSRSIVFGEVAATVNVTVSQLLGANYAKLKSKWIHRMICAVWFLDRQFAAK